MNTALEQAALAEYRDWVRLLELERWGPTRSDPDQALRELIKRERFTSPAQQNNYRPTRRATVSDHQEDLDRIEKTKKRIAAEDAQRAATAVSRAAARGGHGPIPLDRLLAFEEANPARNGRKEESIRVTFGCSTARYYQQLNTAIDNPTALELNPMLINRLRARRARSTTGQASRPTTHQ